MSGWTLDSVRGRLPRYHDAAPLPAPAYAPPATPGPGVGLAVENMRRHTTDEGWQLFAGLQHAGYKLAGFDLPDMNSVDVAAILSHLEPGVAVVQDKREWDVYPGRREWREHRARFVGIERLAERDDVFKLTIIKDAHQRPDYHRQSAAEMGCHAWITYYDPGVVCQLAPYVRPRHLIRVYHSLDSWAVPKYTPDMRGGCLLSGAISGAYPLRTRLFRAAHLLPHTKVTVHPGYHRNGTATPAFLQELSRHRVAICTASLYGYALRKIIEATACGCRVITDLPEDEVLPGIDGNLIRVHHDASVEYVAEVVRNAIDAYDPCFQQDMAETAKARYDYRVQGVMLAAEIEGIRREYRSAHP